MYKNLFESFIKVWRCVVHTINSITPATEVQVTKNCTSEQDLRATYDVTCSEPPQKPNLDTQDRQYNNFTWKWFFKKVTRTDTLNPLNVRCGSSLGAVALLKKANLGILRSDRRRTDWGKKRFYFQCREITDGPSGYFQSRLSMGPAGIHQINTVYKLVG